MSYHYRNTGIQARRYHIKEDGGNKATLLNLMEVGGMNSHLYIQTQDHMEKLKIDSRLKIKAISRQDKM